MKRGTTDHPKMEALAIALNREIYAAVGILNVLWEWAARFTPAGDIGKYNDAVIAKRIGWTGDPGELLEALVSSGWVDESKTYRLVIHDWSHHCEDTVHAALARRGEFFADGTKPKLVKLPKKDKLEAEKRYAQHPSEKSGKKPHRAERSGRKPHSAESSGQPKPSQSPSITKPEPHPQPSAAVAAKTAEMTMRTDHSESAKVATTEQRGVLVAQSAMGSASGSVQRASNLREFAPRVAAEMRQTNISGALALQQPALKYQKPPEIPNMSAEEHEAMEDFIDERWRVHPKKSDLLLDRAALAMLYIRGEDERKKYDEYTSTMHSHPEWTKEGCRYCPKLHDLISNYKYWNAIPPYPESEYAEDAGLKVPVL